MAIDRCYGGDDHAALISRGAPGSMQAKNKAASRASSRGVGARGKSIPLWCNQNRQFTEKCNRLGILYVVQVTVKFDWVPCMCMIR